MIKRILGLLTIAVMIASCGNTENKEVKAPVEVEFASLIENPAQFENSDITITGKVVHVCTMSGKKMYIVGEDPDIRLFITAGDDIPKFPMELLGSEITVTGSFALLETGEKMGEGEHKEGEMSEEAEAELMEGEMGEEAEAAEATEECETEVAMAQQVALKEHVLHYKSHLVK